MNNTICIRCGSIRFNSFAVYKQHMAELHGVHVSEGLKPMRFSSRSKAEIVEAVESLMAKSIFVPVDVKLHTTYLATKTGNI